MSDTDNDVFIEGTDSEPEVEVEDTLTTEAEVETEATEEKEAEVAKKPRVEFSPEQQEVYDESLRKKTAKTAEARAEAEQLQQRLQQAEDRLARYDQPQRPQVPPEPNYLDDDYEQKMGQYAQALRNQASYDAEMSFQQRQYEQSMWENDQKIRERQQKTVRDYAEKVTKLGIEKAVMAKAGPAVAAAIAAYSDPNQPNDLLEYILADEHGPLLTEYLYNNPEELTKLASAGAMQAGELMHSIKSKAISGRRKKSAGPSPLENPEGVGLGEPDGDDKWGTWR